MYFLSKLRTASAVLKSKPTMQTAIRHSGGWYYRRLADPPPNHIIYAANAMGFFMWYWIFYHLWYEPEHITGHYAFPDPQKWTDEELGIPADEEG